MLNCGTCTVMSYAALFRTAYSKQGQCNVTDEILFSTMNSLYSVIITLICANVTTTTTFHCN